MTYLVSLKRYSEFELVVKQLKANGRITQDSEAVFVPLNPKNRKRLLRKRSGFLRSQLIGLFSHEELTQLTEGAAEPEIDDIGEAIQALVTDANALLDTLIDRDMPNEALHHTKRLYDIMMEQAIANKSINEALKAVKFLQRQIELLEKDYRNVDKKVQPASKKRKGISKGNHTKRLA